MYPPFLLKVIESIKGLPGVGQKTAERFAFALLEWPSSRVLELSHLLGEMPTALQSCSECGALLETPPCRFCQRTSDTLCIVASPKEIYSIEETGHYSGYYHVLGGLLSPLEGKGPEVLRLDTLRRRIEALGIAEVIVALDSTLEGDATALYLKKELNGVKTSRLAFGLPMGSPLDYVDSGTLAQALAGRN